MGGIPQEHYEPGSGFEKWVDRRMPVIRFAIDFMKFPTPKNLNWMWIWGVMLTVVLVVQIVTGITLAMHYIPSTESAFASVEHIMRNVEAGWLLRYMHANGASFFFIAVYFHIFRGLYYGSYKEPREITWIIGILIYLAMMATAFMGYVLPWGQMSFWGATVITNLFSAIPLIGDDIVVWLWGGFSVGEPTLTRFFSLHYLLPFVLVGLTVLHIWAFHSTGNNNPTGVEVRRDDLATVKKDAVPFHPFYTVKDMFALALFLALFVVFVFFMPNYLGHPDNYIEADPLVTPAHIVPEWYFLPFYAILRAITFDIFWIIPAKLGGVIAMFGSIVVMALAPWLDTSRTRSGRYRPQFKWWFWLFVVNFFVLMWAGGQPAEGLVPMISLIGTIYWFAYFLVILPLLGLTEKPLPEPGSIEEDFASEHPDAPRAGPAAPGAVPAE